MIKIRIETRRIINTVLEEGAYIYTLPNSGGYGMAREDEEKIFRVLEKGVRYLALERNSDTETVGNVGVRIEDVRLATEEEIIEYFNKYQ